MPSSFVVTFFFFLCVFLFVASAAMKYYSVFLPFFSL